MSNLVNYFEGVGPIRLKNALSWLLFILKFPFVAMS